MNAKNVSIGVLALLAVVFGGLWLVKPYQVVVQQLGASPGPEYTERQVFLGGSVEGGGEVTVLTQTNGDTANAVTVTANQFCNSSVIQFAPQKTAASTTLPTFAQLTNGGCLSKQGQSKTVVFVNTTGTAASTFVLKGAASSSVVNTATSTAPTPRAGEGVVVQAVFTSKAAGTIKYFSNYFGNQ